MFSSIRSRLWVSYALLILVNLVIILSILVIYLIRNPLVYTQTLDNLDNLKTALLIEQPQLASLPPSILKPVLMDFDSQNNVRLILVNNLRQVEVDTRAGTAGTFSRSSIRLFRLSPIIVDSKDQAWLVSISKVPGGDWLVLAVPRPKVPASGLLRKELPPLLFAGVIALLFSLLLAIALSSWIGNPLQRVVLHARRYPQNAGKDLPVTGPREVKELITAFNQMTSRVDASQKSQRDLVANLSHELKTPLTSIQGFAQALLDGAAGTPAARKQAAATILAESGRMHGMVLDLLDLARWDAGTAVLKTTSLSINDLLTNTIQKLQPLVGNAGVVLDSNLSPLPLINGDPDRLAQVFSNLLENAIKFSSPGGKIEVTSQLQDRNISVSIRDHGTGIDPKDLPHIFERFYQGDPSRKGGASHGSGLGLAIAQEIILAHDGKINVLGTQGEGTTFIVLLPISGTTGKIPGLK